MLTAVQGLLSKLLTPFLKKVDEDEYGLYSAAATAETRYLRGSVVTQCCQDYGLIDSSVCFTTEVVLGSIPLQVGDTVNGIAVRDAHGGWRALLVERSADWQEGKASLESDCGRLRSLIGAITSLDRDGGYINQTIYFPRHALCEAFDPEMGDWVKGEYFTSPTQWSNEARSVSPLRSRRLDKVCVTSVCGRSGAVEDGVFFNLDSLLRPAQYQPAVGDLVNLVAVESSQSPYCWRALCMAPNIYSTKAELQGVLENKRGLVISSSPQFGTLLLGETREFVFWIQNSGLETHRLTACEFAGWDAAGQFYLRDYLDGVPEPPAVSKLIYSGHCSPPHPCLAMQISTPYALDMFSGSTGRVNRDDLEGGVDSVEDMRELLIPPGEMVPVRVGCRAKTLGVCEELLLLHFSSFTIGRRVEVRGCSMVESLLEHTAPCCSDALQQLNNGSVTVVPAPPLVNRLKRRHLTSMLGTYPVPKVLRDCVEAQCDVPVLQPCLGEPMYSGNKRNRFSTLLWLEELHVEQELKEFSISGATLRTGAVYLHLDVPGLAEGRPSLFPGDKLILKKQYTGGRRLEVHSFVAEINEEEVSLKVEQEFLASYLGEPLDVEFTLNRVPLRRCHMALEQTSRFQDEESMFFPTAVTPRAPQWSGEWEWEMGQYNDNSEEPSTENEEMTFSISADMVSKATQTKLDSQKEPKVVPKPGHFFNPHLNPSQKEAVKRILAGECRPTPYILFGPPGTGKTITLIEAILQVHYCLSSSRVLVCTPSNSAADLICIRLHESGFLSTATLARVNASCRQEESIPEVLRKYSHEDVRQAAFRRIVVSTCSSAGMFYQIGIDMDHFTHVFVDEAGQATEPEALIPMGLLSERDGQIVLAGDHKQLGPVVKSKLASAFGLGVSLLERLMANPLYSETEWGYHPLLVTKLVYNYRSHEALLELPSRLFYQGALCVRAPRAVVDSLCHWRRLPTKGFPLLFHGIRSSEMKEGDNPSRFNPGEAVQVMFYCCRLAKKLHSPVAASDIGVIAPYRKQAEKIRVLLHRVGLMDIKVGSVEEFQGQEFLVILLSTVRSDESVTQDDLRSSLGFLTNAKRFNVAITRAKALLIIVGNPHVLVKDACFNALLQYTFDNGALVGCDPPPSLKTSHRAAGDEA